MSIRWTDEDRRNGPPPVPFKKKEGAVFAIALTVLIWLMALMFIFAGPDDVNYSYDHDCTDGQYVKEASCATD